MSDSNDQVLARIRKNAREELRVSVGDFRGHSLAHLRVYVPSNDGEYIATTKA